MKISGLIFLIISILWIIYIICGCIWGYFQEKKHFNNGICPNCGEPLRYFDSDSQGGQGWTCDKCNYTTWISWFKIYKHK